MVGFTALVPWMAVFPRHATTVTHAPGRWTWSKIDRNLLGIEPRAYRLRLLFLPDADVAADVPGPSTGTIGWDEMFSRKVLMTVAV